MPKFQQTDYYCGPAALQAALVVLGFRSKQSKLAVLCGTTPDGTTEEGLQAAMVAMDIEFEVFECTERFQAKAWIEDTTPRYPVLLCTMQWEHWVCAAGRCGDRIFIFDSDNTRYNRERNGCQPMTTKSLLQLWRAGRRVAGKEHRFYAIGVRRKV